MNDSLPKWRTITIGELGKIVTGKTPPTEHLELFGDDYPFITPTDINDNERNVKTERFLSESGRLYLKNYILSPQTPCFVCIGATIGKMCVTSKSSFTNQQINSILVDKTNHDPRFVFYLLRHNSSRIKLRAGGAATPIINKTAFSQVQVIVPPLPTQRKITAILSVYDDLIENNTRRIKILEEMTQKLYTDWFVKFRFPGYEQMVMKETDWGVFPDDWVTCKLVDMCASITDGDWIETKDQGGNDYRLLQVSNIGIGKFVETGNFRYVTKETYNRLHCQEVVPGVILIARMPKPTGRAWLVTPQDWKMITAVDVAIIKPNLRIVNPYFLLNLLNSEQQLERVGTNTTGATRARATRSSLSSMVEICPPLELQMKFAEFAEPAYMLNGKLQKKNAKLIELRNLLLPKLISGELDVSALGIETGDDE